MPQQQGKSFTDDLATVQKSFEDDLKTVQESVQKKQDVPHPVVERLLDWLPAAGGAAGGIIGGIGGTVLGVGVGGVPGAIGGAALGGAAGEAGKELINRFVGNPAPQTSEQAASAIAGQGAIQGGSEALGAGMAVAAKPVARVLMQSAVKPAYAAMANTARKAEIPRVVKTLLDEGINVTQGGVRKLNDLLGSTNAQIADIIRNSTGKVYPEAVAARADEVAAKFGNQVAPQGDVAAVKSVQDQFMQAHGGGPMRPATPLTDQEAQVLKVGTYKALGSRAYGEVKGATTEAEKALARGLKEDIETNAAAQGKDIKGLNQRDSQLMEARDAIAKRVALAGNRDPGGLGFIADNPKSVLAFVMARSPAVKSMIARGLYSSAGVAAKVDPQIIRLAVQALASSQEP